MYATVQTRPTNNFSSRNRAIKAVSVAPIAQRDSEKFPAEADTWDTYLNRLRKSTVDAISAKKIAQRAYLTVLAEADTWEKRLEIALNNDCEDLVRKTLLLKTAYRDKARNLQAIIEKHSVQVSALKDKLDFWENQLAR
jgi:phage shock protein A